MTENEDYNRKILELFFEVNTVSHEEQAQILKILSATDEIGIPEIIKILENED